MGALTWYRWIEILQLQMFVARGWHDIWDTRGTAVKNGDSKLICRIWSRLTIDDVSGMISTRPPLGWPVREEEGGQRRDKGWTRQCLRVNYKRPFIFFLLLLLSGRSTSSVASSSASLRYHCFSSQFSSLFSRRGGCFALHTPPDI